MPPCGGEFLGNKYLPAPILGQRPALNGLFITPRAVRHYEAGQNRPDFNGLIKLADYFQVSLDYLVGRSDNPKIS